MSTTFRKRPVEIEAMQTAPIDPLVAEKDREEQNRLVAQWISNEGGVIADFGVNFIEIDTLEGTMTASPGDWIIRGVQGEFYPCKPDIFEQTYAQVDAIPDLSDIRSALVLHLTTAGFDLPNLEYDADNEISVEGRVAGRETEFRITIGSL